MFVISTADELVEFVKSYTGSTNDTEIKQCIFMAEMSMRNLELPALRSNPYDAANIGTADANGFIPIPGDMNKPIIFFKQGTPGGGTSSSTGPWIVYDRVGDRDIISETMVANLYLDPVNIPSLIRGKFSEVGLTYQFAPALSQGDLVNLYYYKAWALLFSPTSTVIDAEATITSYGGAGPWTATISYLDTLGVEVGNTITATDGTGSLGGGQAVVTAVDSGANQVDLLITGGTGPVLGTITAVTLGSIVQTNPVLATFPEGYVYATLREYYLKRHNDGDAAIHDAKFKEAYQVVEDQNNKGKWSGGHTRLTSIFQPRPYRRYNMK